MRLYTYTETQYINEQWSQVMCYMLKPSKSSRLQKAASGISIESIELKHSNSDECSWKPFKSIWWSLIIASSLHTVTNFRCIEHNRASVHFCGLKRYCIISSWVIVCRPMVTVSSATPLEQHYKNSLPTCKWRFQYQWSQTFFRAPFLSSHICGISLLKNRTDAKCGEKKLFRNHFEWCSRNVGIN